MDIEPKSETEDEPERDNPTEEDIAEEDTVVREIDVFFSHSIDADIQVRVSLLQFCIIIITFFIFF